MGNKIFGIEIKTAQWVKGNDMVFYYDGVDEMVYLNATNKKLTKTLKEPQMVIYHAGETISLKDLRANASHKSKLAPTPLSKQG